MSSTFKKLRWSLVGGAAFLGTAVIGANSAYAGFEQISVASNSADFVKIENVTGHQVKPGDVVRVGKNGAMGFRLPDGSAFVIGDLHSTRTDVGGVEVTNYTPAANGKGAVVEITMTEGNLAVDNTLAPDTRIIVRTRDSVVEVPPGSNTICITALPDASRKGQRTMTSVRDGVALFSNNASGSAQRITNAKSVASNGANGQPRPINHPYMDCCGALESKRQAVLAGPVGVQQGMGPVALYSPAPPAVPAAGVTAQAPIPGGVSLENVAIGVGAAALIGGGAVGLILGLDGGDNPAPSATTTTGTN